MTFKFLDTIEDGMTSPYVQYLKETICIDLGKKNLKLDYLKSRGYRKTPDANGQRDYITEEQFGILLYLEQLYHDTFLRPGCERFWKDSERSENKEYSKEIKNKKRLTQRDWSIDEAELKKSYSIEI